MVRLALAYTRDGAAEPNTLKGVMQKEYER
jgi:hypothetical protein